MNRSRAQKNVLRAPAGVMEANVIRELHCADELDRTPRNLTWVGGSYEIYDQTKIQIHMQLRSYVTEPF
jgi:hypothetical protein